MSKRAVVAIQTLQSRLHTPSLLPSPAWLDHLIPHIQRYVRLAVVMVALGATVAGALVAVRALTMPTMTAEVGDTLSIGDVLLTVTKANWIAEHKHTDDTNEVTLLPAGVEPAADASAGGYAMPAAMMPGMPEEGLRRLRLVVTFTNPGEGNQVVGAGEFVVAGSDGRTWPLLGNSSLRSQELAPGQSIEGVLFADVPADTPDLALLWSRSGASVRFLLGSAPGHSDEHS